MDFEYALFATLDTPGTLPPPPPTPALAGPTRPAQVHGTTIRHAWGASPLPQVPARKAGDPARDPAHEHLLAQVAARLGHFTALFAAGQALGLTDGALDYDVIHAVMAALQTPGRQLVYSNSTRELALWLDGLDNTKQVGRFAVVLHCDTPQTDHSVGMSVERTEDGCTRIHVFESLQAGNEHHGHVQRELHDVLDERPALTWQTHDVPVQARDIGCPFHALWLAAIGPAHLQPDGSLQGSPWLVCHAETTGRLVAIERQGIAKRSDPMPGHEPTTLQEYVDAHTGPELDHRRQPMSDAIERFRLDALEHTHRWLSVASSDAVHRQLAHARPEDQGGFRSSALRIAALHRAPAGITGFRDLQRHDQGPARQFWQPSQVTSPAPVHLRGARQGQGA